MKKQQYNQELTNLINFMLCSNDGVHNNFWKNIKGAYSDGTNNERFTYIQGKRKDKVLLVAHADTVWPGVRVMPIVKNGEIISGYKEPIEVKNEYGVITKKKIGIGADDRAGCAALWHLKNLGHSLLITSGEENHLKGSKYLMRSDWWKNEINSHQFIIQFDRANKNDLVFYDVGTKDFVEYMVEKTGYKPERGISTDIRELCKDICGVNISIGYYNQHKENEKLVLSEYFNTLAIIKKLLSQENIPRFELDKKNLFYISYSGNTCWNNHDSHDYGAYYNNANYENKHKSWSDKLFDKALGTTVVCDECGNNMNQLDWHNNYLRCTKCKADV